MNVFTFTLYPPAPYLESSGNRPSRASWDSLIEHYEMPDIQLKNSALRSDLLRIQTTCRLSPRTHFSCPSRTIWSAGDRHQDGELRALPTSLCHQGSNLASLVAEILSRSTTWTQASPNTSVGDMVTVNEYNMPPQRWITFNGVRILGSSPTEFVNTSCK